MICSLLLSRSIIALQVAFCSVAWLGQAPIHFQEETISLCHPERSEGSLAGQRSFAALRMTLLKRLRLTRKTSSLQCIERKGAEMLDTCDILSLSEPPVKPLVLQTGDRRAFLVGEGH